MSKTVNLGACTAYGIARKYGYTGTEEEWNALQNRLKNEAATYANSARSSASAALTSEQKAAASEANAKAYMDSAEESKNAAFSTTPEGYEANVQKLEDMDIQTATGENLTLVGTKKGGVKLNSVKGKSVQNQYIGKNLLPYPYTETTKTVNGITFTDNGDGSITINGTATADAYFSLASKISLPVGSYRISGNASIMYIYKSSDTTWHQGLSIISEDEKVTVGICIQSGSMKNNYILYPQLESGDTATDYEPYVGVMPAPSPDYPQEINSIGDVGSVKIMSCGKNLAPYDKFHDVGYMYSNLSLSDRYCVFPKGTYTLSFNGYTSDGGSFDLTVRTPESKGEGGKFFSVDSISYSNKKYTKTFTIEDVWCISFYINSAAVAITNFQIEVGDTATDYEPYQSTEITIPLTEPLRSIGDVKDEIVIQDGKWGVLRRIGREIIDSNNVDSYIITYKETINGCAACTVLSHNSKVPKLPLDDNSLRINMFTYVGDNTIIKSNVTGIIGWGRYSKEKTIYFNITGNTLTLDEVKAKCLDNNMEIIYVLATPTFEPFEDQTPFYGLSSFDTVTNIITDQTIEPILDIEYGKSQVGAYTLENHNLSKKNEALLTDLQTAYLTTLSQEV